VSIAKRLHYTYQQYLTLLEASDFKLEFCDGVIYAMAGGTPTHAALGAAATALLRGALRGRCTVFSSDLKVRIEASDLSTFPDGSVVCGPQAASPLDAQAITNPALLVEVTSPSTEDYDRGDKLSHYKQLPSLRAVLYVSHRLRSVTMVHLTSAGWAEREFRSGERVVLSEPALEFEVDALYEGLALEP
jgi:Uma2 family endonuclease